jgi:UDP-N-acetylmuramate dehydrogenase
MEAVEQPDLLSVRNQVLALRRRKSMVWDPNDPNRRSAGSFFTNPIVSEQEAERVSRRALDASVIGSAADMPRYPAGQGMVKLAAGWLIERAGIPKGYRKGTVGVSTRHALALVHHGGGTTKELLSLAAEVRSAVEATFGVTLAPEPRFWGTTLASTRYGN